MALSMVVAAGRLAVGDESGVESAEEFRRVCESALDDLLHGNAAGLEILYRADSEAVFPAFSDRLRRQYENNQQDRGEPLDWRFLGTRQIGTGLRQYLYVCRYTRMPIIWRFAALEQEGRWVLGFCSFHPDAKTLLAGVPLRRCEEQEYLTLCEKVAKAFAHGDGEALTLVRDSVDPRSPAYSLEITRINALLLALSKESGKLVRYEPAGTREIAGVLARCDYVAQFEHRWFVYHFDLYRPGEEWKLLRVECDYNHEAALESFPLVTEGQASRVLTARSPEGDGGKKAETPLR